MMHLTKKQKKQKKTYIVFCNFFSHLKLFLRQTWSIILGRFTFFLSLLSLLRKTNKKGIFKQSLKFLFSKTQM